MLHLRCNQKTKGLNMIKHINKILNGTPAGEIKQVFDTKKQIKELKNTCSDCIKVINEAKKLGISYKSALWVMIAEERHTNPFIDYDAKMEVYYAWGRGLLQRRNLNKIIKHYLLGLISDYEYKKIIDSINSQLDLNKMSTQKQFIQDRVMEIWEDDPYKSKNQCKQEAKAELQSILMEQERRKRHYCSWYENPGL